MIVICLKELAEAKNLNMSQVQRRADLTMGLVRRYWYNDTASVDLRAIDRLCALLDCEPCDLIKRIPSPTA